MKTSILLTAAAVALLAPCPLGAAEVDSTKEPSTGIAHIVTGSIFTGVGAVNLLTAPLCKTSVVQQSLQDTCLGLAIGVGVVAVAVGVPLLIVGINKRKAYKEWESAHPIAAGLSFAPTRRGVALAWRATF
jgi:hypothetical protein